jgi:cell division protease FtsH
MIDREIKALVDKAYERCESILKDSIKILHSVAEYLLDKETMDAETFETFFNTGLVTE